MATDLIDVTEDLKQFITANVSHHSSETRTDIGELKQGATQLKQDVTQLKQDIKRLDQKVDGLPGAFAEALDNHAVAADHQLKNHEQRISRLEAKAA